MAKAVITFRDDGLSTKITVKYDPPLQKGQGIASNAQSMAFAIMQGMASEELSDALGEWSDGGDDNNS